ncbi:MAG: hypothetical protein AB1566_13485 [Chloroflexota bacterium]
MGVFLVGKLRGPEPRDPGPAASQPVAAVRASLRPSDADGCAGNDHPGVPPLEVMPRVPDVPSIHT